MSKFMSDDVLDKRSYGYRLFELIVAIEADLGGIDKDAPPPRRRPQPGQHYKAFAVDPINPGPQTLMIGHREVVVHPRNLGLHTLMIGHREGEKYIVDLMRDGLTTEQTYALLNDYDIDTVIADVAKDDVDPWWYALVGLCHVLKEVDLYD
jgi:hypothetical protein